MDNWEIGRNNGCNEKKSNLFKENKQVLAHTINHSFKTLEWQDKVKDDIPIKCVNEQGR
jgi:hypothetical protein